MKKKTTAIFIIIALLIISLAGFIISNIISDSGANKEQINASEYFKVSGDRVAILYNNELQTAKGIDKDGNIYLPITWVNTILNDRFYWNATEELLSYALSESILYCDYTTVGNNGQNLLIKDGDETYISIDIVKTYTDIKFSYYDNEEAKRVYISNIYGDYLNATTKRKVKLRDIGDKTGKIVHELESGSKVRLILYDISNEYIKSKDLKWVLILTEDGFIGFVEKSKLRSFDKNTEKSNFKPETYANISMDEKVVLAWHQVTTRDANKGVQSVIENTKGLNVISPTWFALSDNDGNYTSIASKDYVDYAHSKGIKVWALIDNFSKEVNSEILFSKTKARENLIDSLISDVKTYGLDGINIDVESIRQEAGIHYIQFIRELSVACRINKVVLSVDVPNYASYNRFYNRKALAEVSDYIINMGYDEHYAGSEAGSVASIDYVKGSIEETLNEGVNPSKLINAMPLYTRIWNGSSSKAVGISAALKWIEENKVNLTWDNELGQYYGEAEIDGKKSMIWMEEEKSLELKVNVAKDNNLAGVALWKLGLEPAEIWDTILKINE